MTARFYRRLGWLATLLLFCLQTAFAQSDKDFPAKPNPLKPVNDFADVLSDAEEARLSAKLQAFDDSTSNTVTIVTLTSIGDYDIADYAVQLANRWKIGRGAKDNGVIILAAIGDRKINISPGYGLEGALPDALCGRIIRNEITPAFKQGQYYQGFSQGGDAIIAATKGEYTNDDPKEQHGKSPGVPGIVILVVIVYIIIWIISKMGGGGGNYMSGRGSRRWGSAGPIIWGGLGGFGGGSSGGGWGGGSSGGSFGGGGGGSFGGGGASGSW